METKRGILIQQGYIVDLPLIKRKHNEYRKDIPLTTEQIESLKKNYGIIALKLKEEDVLPILRKKLKHYKFTKVFFNIEDLN